MSTQKTPQVISGPWKAEETKETESAEAFFTRMPTLLRSAEAAEMLLTWIQTLPRSVEAAETFLTCLDALVERGSDGGQDEGEDEHRLGHLVACHEVEGGREDGGAVCDDGQVDDGARHVVLQLEHEDDAAEVDEGEGRELASDTHALVVVGCDAVSGLY